MQHDRFQHLIVTTNSIDRQEPLTHVLTLTTTGMRFPTLLMIVRYLTKLQFIYLLLKFLSELADT